MIVTTTATIINLKILRMLLLIIKEKVLFRDSISMMNLHLLSWKVLVPTLKMVEQYKVTKQESHSRRIRCRKRILIEGTLLTNLCPNLSLNQIASLLWTLSGETTKTTATSKAPKFSQTSNWQKRHSAVGQVQHLRLRNDATTIIWTWPSHKVTL